MPLSSQPLHRGLACLHRDASHTSRSLRSLFGPRAELLPVRTGAETSYDEALDEAPELDEPLADPEGLLSLRESVR